MLHPIEEIFSTLPFLLYLRFMLYCQHNLSNGGIIAMKYKAVLFDMDGTVLDTLDDLRDSMNYSLAQFGYPERSREYVAASLGNGAAFLTRRCAPEGISEDDLSRLTAFYRDWYDAHALIKTAPYAGILSLMSRLSELGIKTAIISNKPHSAVIPLAEKFFPGIYSVGEKAGIARKPAPDMVLAVMNDFNLSPADCVYIGDTEVDLQTAAAAGCGCISVTWGFRSEGELIASGAKTVVKSVAELETLLCD